MVSAPPHLQNAASIQSGWVSKRRGATGELSNTFLEELEVIAHDAAGAGGVMCTDGVQNRLMVLNGAERHGIIRNEFLQCFVEQGLQRFVREQEDLVLRRAGKRRRGDLSQNGAR